MAELEAKVDNIMKTMTELLEKNKILEDGLKRCQDEIADLKKSKTQQQQESESITPPPSTSPSEMKPNKPENSETPEQLKMKEDCHFLLSTPSVESIVTGQAFVIKGYSEIEIFSPFVDPESGFFKTPIQGEYSLGGCVWHSDMGKIEIYLCEDKEGRREYLGTAGNICGVSKVRNGDGKAVTWQLTEGVKVWLECCRVEGLAEVDNVSFDCDLMEILVDEKEKPAESTD